VHDLQHEDHRVSRPPVGVLAARLAQARAERELRHAREQDGAAGIVAGADGDRASEERGADAKPGRPTMPLFRRTQLDGRKLSESDEVRRSALERGLVLDDKLTPAQSHEPTAETPAMRAALTTRTTPSMPLAPPPAPSPAPSMTAVMGKERLASTATPSSAAPLASGQGGGSPLIEATSPNVTPIDSVRPRPGAPDTGAISGSGALHAGERGDTARDASVSGATTESGEVAELRAQVRQARDELAAVRRRGEREKEEYTRFARGETVKNVIPVLDDLERALSHVPAHLRDDPWVAGMALVGESVGALLRREGVERIDPHGQPFDPHQHEAIARIEGDGAAGRASDPDGAVEHRVTQVYRPGYILHGRVLRPAQVQVTTTTNYQTVDISRRLMSTV